MARLRGEMQGRVAVGVSSVGVGALLEEESGDGFVAGADCSVEG